MKEGVCGEIGETSPFVAGSNPALGTHTIWIYFSEILDFFSENTVVRLSRKLRFYTLGKRDFNSSLLIDNGNTLS